MDKPGIVAHTCYLSTWEVGARRISSSGSWPSTVAQTFNPSRGTWPLWVWSQSALHNKFQDNQRYIVETCLRRREESDGEGRGGRDEGEEEEWGRGRGGRGRRSFRIISFCCMKSCLKKYTFVLSLSPNKWIWLNPKFLRLCGDGFIQSHIQLQNKLGSSVLWVCLLLSCDGV